jgi:hypothetical protein
MLGTGRCLPDGTGVQAPEEKRASGSEGRVAIYPDVMQE